MEEWRAENCLNKPSKDWNEMVLVPSVISERNPSARDTFRKRWWIVGKCRRLDKTLCLQ